MAPQAARSIPVDKMANQGAMADASRAYRVAFFADPAGSPEMLEVSAGLGGSRVLAAQWTTELARLMNRVIAKVSLFDERFQELAVEIFNHEVQDGDVVYKWRLPKAGLNVGRARVATLVLKELKTTSGSEGISGQALIEVTMTGFVHMYTCEATGRDDWLARTMACLGEKVLGDPSFWKGVQAVP